MSDNDKDNNDVSDMDFVVDDTEDDTNDDTNDTNDTKENETKKEKSTWLEATGFEDFIYATIKGIIILLIYLYFGTSYYLISKSAESQEGGLSGQDINGYPYTGNFSECKLSDLDVSDPISKWEFPYKNPVTCNAEANKHRPLYFRFVSWSISIIAYSFSTGRTYLNNEFTSIDETYTVLLGPILILLLLLVSSSFGWVSGIIGSFYNMNKLLPTCYFSVWFPFITLIAFIWGLSTYPILIGIYQFMAMAYYLILHASFNKLSIIENGIKTTTTGIPYILKRTITNTMFMFLAALISAYHAYSKLELVYAFPIIGWICYIIFTKLILI